MCLECQQIFPLPGRRSLRRRMKRSTQRKKSSAERININRFWNEMEDFLDRFESEKFLTTTQFEDYETESDIISIKDIFYDDDDLSCYCSVSSYNTSRSESVMSDSSNYGQYYQGTVLEERSFSPITKDNLPLPPDSSERLPPPCLPLPPASSSTRVVLDLMTRNLMPRLNTLV